MNSRKSSNLITSKKTFDFFDKVPLPENIDVNQIPPYTKPSNDSLLLKFAQMSNLKYIMSTSTISSCMSQIFYLMENFKNPNMNQVSNFYGSFSDKYMSSQRKPTTNILRKVDKEKGIYALDSDTNPFEASNEILMFMGKVFERMYTMEVDEFNSLLVKSKQDLSNAVPLEEDYHRFLIMNQKVCLRSQIDCMAELDDGEKIVFEIKTRAVAPLRYDILNYKKYLDYKIDRICGDHSSFEREYYDLIRGAFLKYFFQLKIGQMSGSFMSYHNTRTHFGFEYVSMDIIEKILFGSSFKANISFVMYSKITTLLLDELLEAIKTEDFDYIRVGNNISNNFNTNRFCIQFKF